MHTEITRAQVQTTYDVNYNDNIYCVIEVFDSTTESFGYTVLFEGEELPDNDLAQNIIQAVIAFELL